jgi:hypothetical protein
MTTRSFWITNITNRNVTLADLYISVPAMTSINLLDSKHYSFTLDQIHKSVTKGSIFKKRAMIVVRRVSPYLEKSSNVSMQAAAMPNRSKSSYQMKEDKFDELAISDEEFADQTSDSVSIDKPVIK